MSLNSDKEQEEIPSMKIEEEEEQNDNVVGEKTSEEEDMTIEFEHDKTTTTLWKYSFDCFPGDEEKEKEEKEKVKEEKEEEEEEETPLVATMPQEPQVTSSPPKEKAFAEKTRTTTPLTTSRTTPGGQDSVLNYVEELSFRSSVLDGKTDLSFRNLHTQEQVSNKDGSFFDSISRSVIVRLPCEIYIYIYIYMHIFIASGIDLGCGWSENQTSRLIVCFLYALFCFFLIWNSTVCSRKGPRAGRIE